jgi:putative ABC transport system permease protein
MRDQPAPSGAERTRHGDEHGVTTPAAPAPSNPVMLVHHVRHAVRLLFREPGFSAAAILTLALGVGANVAVFALIEAVLLRPLPFAHADDLLVLSHRDRRTGITKEFIAIADYVDLAARQSTLESLVAFGSGQSTIFGDGEPLRVTSLSATPDLFDTLKVPPALGRFLVGADARQGAAPVAVIGHEVWQTYFRGDPDLIGRSIKVGTGTRQVVGIAPRGFRFPPSQEPAGIIVPMVVPSVAPAARKSGWVFAVARVKPGVTVEQATANLAAVARDLEREHPTQNQGSEYFARSLRESLVSDTRRPLVLMLAAVAVVLLVACANVGNLLLSRALGRRQEMAVRAALGAGRARLAAQLLIESAVLAAAAGAAGVAIAYWGAPALVALVPRSVAVPGLSEVGLNGRVLAFALGTTVLTALIFGSIAALASAPRASGALGTRGVAGGSLAARRASSALVVAEVALAIVLLAGAALVLRSFGRLLAVEPGFTTERVLTIEVALPADRYAEPPSRKAFYDRVLPSLAQLPAVEHAGAAVVTPLTGNNWTVPFERRDRPVPAGERPPDVGWQLASGDYFKALGIPLLAGRLFDTRDTPSSPPSVIISRAIERQFFPGENPIGMRVRLGNESDAEIVGVVGDIRRAGLTDQPRADMYFPFELAPQMAITLFVRTAGDPLEALPSLTSSLRGHEPRLVIGEVSTLAAIARASMGATRLMVWLLGIFAGVALTLACVGVYGVMSYAVRQRTREIGMRMALGATRGNIMWTVMRRGAAIAAVGVALGLVAALTAAQSLSALLYGVTATDPASMIAAAATLAAATLAACYLPARRATRVDPARILANE